MAESYLQIPTQNQVKKPSIKRWVILGVVFIFVVLATATGLYIWNKQAHVQEVIDGLKQVPALMEKAKASADGGYPATISSSQLPKSENVKYIGIGSFDGTTYCVTGTSKKDDKIVYHITATSQEPEVGDCQTAASLPKPNAPGNLALQMVGQTQATMSWATVTYATSYTVECATDTEFKTDRVTKEAITTSGVCEGLKSKTKYYVHIRANNNTGSGVWSEVLEFTTAALSLAPTNVTATALSSSEFTYSWNAVVGAKEYILERASDNSFMSEVVSLTIPAGGALSGTFKGLKPDTYYWIHVKAVTADFDVSQAAFSQVVEVRTLKAN